LLASTNPSLSTLFSTPFRRYVPPKKTAPPSLSCQFWSLAGFFSYCTLPITGCLQTLSPFHFTIPFAEWGGFFFVFQGLGPHKHLCTVLSAFGYISQGLTSFGEKGGEALLSVICFQNNDSLDHSVPPGGAMASLSPTFFVSFRA